LAGSNALGYLVSFDREKKFYNAATRKAVSVFWILHKFWFTGPEEKDIASPAEASVQGPII
jgi:hypothetical protein